jgi:hypothetical protein
MSVASRRIQTGCCSLNLAADQLRSDPAPVRDLGLARARSVSAPEYRSACELPMVRRSEDRQSHRRCWAVQRGSARESASKAAMMREKAATRESGLRLVRAGGMENSGQAARSFPQGQRSPVEERSSRDKCRMCRAQGPYSRQRAASSPRKASATSSEWSSWVGSLRTSGRERRGIALERGDLTAPFRNRVERGCRRTAQACGPNFGRAEF